jgi:TonB family protein
MTGPNLARAALLLVLLLPAARAAADAPPALTKAPLLSHFVEASPPAALAEVGRADVTLAIDIDEAGKVTAVEVVQTAGTDFDEAALAAARQFEFQPGEFEGKPVPVRITYRYHFAMKPAPPPSAPPSAPPAIVTVPVSGRVLVKGDRTALPGITVILDQAELQTVTDEQGAFHFDAVPVGGHTLALRGGAIAAVDAPIVANAGKSLSLTYFVAAKERYSSTVRGAKAVVETVEQTLAADEIKRIPGTQGDVLKAVQNLPGVARAPFGNGLLIVWGSAPEDTRTYVDGVYIPTLYHFGGLRSTLNGEMISSLSFAPGAYGVEHGLGLGGVIDIESRKPRSDGYHGYAQIDLVDASAMVEGPITKKLSFAAAARASLIGLSLPLLTGGSHLQLTTQYYDYQARLTYRPTTRDDLDLFFFGSDDAIDLLQKNSNPTLSASFGSHTYYHRGIASWVHRFAGRATLSLTTSLGYDVPFQEHIAIAGSTISATPGLLSYTLRAVARIPLASWLRLDAGVDYEGNRFAFARGANSAAGGTGTQVLTQSGNTTGTTAPDQLVLYTNHTAPYASATFSFFDKKLTIVPQLRLAVLSFAGYPGAHDSFASAFVRPEPRLSVRYQALPWLALKAGFGLFDQPPQPQDLSAVYGNPKLRPELGLHYVAGFEFQPMPTLHIELEGFYKDLRDLIVVGEAASDATLVNRGIGRVYGAELLVRQELFHHFFGWVSYTLSRSERKDQPDQPWHIFQYDQTHVLTIVGSYQLPRGFQVGLRFRYGTGNPYTPVKSAYYNSNSGTYTPVLGATYGARLPAFSQLDLRVDKTWTFSRWRLAVYLDLMNAYNAKNPEAVTYNFNYTKPSALSVLPILPVLGIRGEF